MNIELIERLIKLAERSGLTELEYSEDNSRVRFNFHPIEGAAAHCSAIQGPQVEPMTSPEAPSSLQQGHAVKSSLSGTFYRGSAPEEPPFVTVGDRVEEGQTLAIIEAMKMLNPIESPLSGRVLEILIDDGSMVESGLPLFIIAEEG
ncbi:acetyl-CoA carboxylase biotin carboxyl carrier protein [Pseudomonas sp. CCM 7891]|uniref:Biotin carboxyl carrier protein of acetyl-CoA carboxylase n=1 Tax=Pseudomonas karstica TaxID=1055468 RepID=A0A7X2RSB2_9PSED|nr:acetyl-CoA carboxylase biotin carboxyl carrier protein [Pseudomonas karstica]MTD19314.1 acetyl-CoA carboxylase biotin carboxyl carrier protein [Pseudomonas karstica]